LPISWEVRRRRCGWRVCTRWKRVAQKNPDQRQTIVDVICAYLRRYTPPDEQPPAEDALANMHTRYENRRQELLPSQAL
jgi:hypothetical protein